MNRAPLQWKRIAPGRYEATIGDDYLDRYEITRGDKRGDWFLTYPGEFRADGWASTKRECVRYAEQHAQIEVPS